MIRTTAALLLGGIAAIATPSIAAPKEGSLAIVGATVFDATGAAPRIATVLVEDGRIVRVGPGLKPPAGVRIIDGRGKALLPGFFDLHTHWTPATT